MLWWTVTFQLFTRLAASNALPPGHNPHLSTLPVFAVPRADTRLAASNALPPGHNRHLSTLPVFAVPRADTRRLSVVTDSISTGSLYGGVGTALILAALAARQIDSGLRIVTRTEPPDVGRVGAVLNAHGISWKRNIEFVFASQVGGPGSHDVPVAVNDLFLTTSWWTTWSVRQSVARERIACLVQEDERLFYPFGDEHLRCTETLSDPRLLYLVNTKLLLGHLHDDGLVPGATAFEPSFPMHLYHPAAPGLRQAGAKRNFFFYARPKNVRNLYWRGLEALSAAIEEGILDPQEWDFHFVGHDASPVSLPRGAKALFSGPMSWSDYAAFVRRMDVGLSLIYTPHPSYPPLHLAASGAVVVTNQFGRKRNLDRYSSNILCVDLDVPSLVGAIRKATVMAADAELRSTNFAGNGLQRDWAISLAPALERLAAWAKA